LADNEELSEKADLGADDLDRIYTELTAVADASLLAQTRPFAWLGAFEEDVADPTTQDDGASEAMLDRRRLLYATPNLDFSRLQPAKPALAGLQKTIDQLTAQYEGRVSAIVTGDPALRADELKSVTKGIGVSFAVSFVFVGILLFLAFRSLYLSIATLASLVITIILTGAFAAATVGELNLVSVAFTVLLVGLGLDFAIHLLLHIQEQRTAGEETRDAIRQAGRGVGAGLTIAAPTTAVGFLAFTPTSFDGIAQLGLIAGVGVIIAFIVASTFLPALFAVVQPSKKPANANRAGGLLKGLEGVSGPVSIIVILLGAAGLVFIPKARFDADPMSLRNPQSLSVQGFNRLFDDPNTAPYRASILATELGEASEIAEKASALPTVGSVRSVQDFIPDDQLEKLDVIDFAAGGLAFALGGPGSGPSLSAPAQKDASTTAPSTTAALDFADQLKSAPARVAKTKLAVVLERLATNPTAYRLFEDQVFRFWPQLTDVLSAQLTADVFDIDALPDTLRSRYVSPDGLVRVDLLPSEDVRDRQKLDAFVDAIQTAFPDAAGGAVQNASAGSLIASAMLQATLIAFGAITILLVFLIRDPVKVLFVLFPIALAGLLTVSTGVALDLPFNYANVIVLPLLIGIGVDSGIHLVLRERHMRQGEALFDTSTPSAVFFSATTTVASFGSLMLSSHKGTASMGQLLSIAIAFTLVCTLVVLPAMMRLHRARFSKAADTH
ncbi:MAG: MMPL family transporter, partial [Pseudomonadota bacterium]